MNQNGEHLMNICELNILEIFLMCIALLHMIAKARTFESTNHIKTKIIRHTTELWKMHALGKEYDSRMFAESVSQSMFYQVLNTVSDDVFEENV